MSRQRLSNDPFMGLERHIGRCEIVGGRVGRNWRVRFVGRVGLARILPVPMHVASSVWDILHATEVVTQPWIKGIQI